MNIVFQKLVLKNFMSVGQEPIEFEFNKGIHFITGFNKDEKSRNGVGKTTILAGIFYALYGKTDRDKMLKSAIPHKYNEDPCFVELTYKVGNDIHRVVRQLRPSKVHYFVNDEDKSKTTSSIDEDIVKSIGNTDMDLFEKTIIMTSNNNVPFLSPHNKSADKVSFIEGILSLGFFGDLLDKARKRANANDKQLTVEKTKLNTILTQFEQQKTSLEQFERSKESDILNINKEISELEQKILRVKEAKQGASVKAFKDKIKELGDSIPEMEATFKENSLNVSKVIEEYESKVKELYSKSDDSLEDNNKKKEELYNKLEVLKEKENNASKIKQKLNEEKAEYNAEINRIKKDIQKLENTPTNCPTCKQSLKNIDHNHLVESKKELEREMEGFVQKIKEVDDKFVDFNEKFDKLTSIKNATNESIRNIDKEVLEASKKKNDEINEIKKLIEQEKDKTVNLSIEHSRNLNDVRHKINTLNLKIEKLESLDKEIEKYENTIINKKEQIKQINDKENPFLSIIKETKESIEDSEKKVSDLEYKEKVYDTVKYVVSPEGLKSFMIKKIIKLFNQRMDYYLKRLNSKYFCTFDEFFNESIFDHKGVETGYSNLSGGERKRLDVAMLFTFRDVRKHQTGITFNISVFDEIFDSAIDSTGMDNIISILQDSVDNQDESIYIVTHRKENCDYENIKVVELVKENNCTKLVK